MEYHIGDVVTLCYDHPPEWEKLFHDWRRLVVSQVEMVGAYQSLHFEGEEQTASNNNIRCLLQRGPW